MHTWLKATIPCDERVGCWYLPHAWTTPEPLFSKFTDLFLVFLTFSSNKRWWRLLRIFLFGRCCFGFLPALPSKGRLRQTSPHIYTPTHIFLYLFDVTFFPPSFLCNLLPRFFVAAHQHLCHVFLHYYQPIWRFISISTMSKSLLDKFIVFL